MAVTAILIFVGRGPADRNFHLTFPGWESLKSGSVKTIRFLVLLLVVLLLPFRGVVAATMVCTNAAAGSVGVVHAHQGMPHHDGSVPGANGPGHPPAEADAGHAGHDGHDGAEGDSSSGGESGGETCSVCASGCHAAAVVTELPALWAPPITASVVFPALCVPVPDFHSEGPERPPRTV